MKSLDTVPSDIDALFSEGTEINEEYLQQFLKGMEELLRRRLTKKDDAPSETVRMSKLGIPDRKLWFDHHHGNDRKEVKNALKFIYGDIVEQLVLFLVKQSGHTVTDEQREVEIDGVLGHLDCVIDNVVCDVKSTSSFAFKKFFNATLYKDDPFGYIAQLSAYMHSVGNSNGAFIAVNKESGEITILRLDSIDTVEPKQRIKDIRGFLELPTPPEQKCYEPVPMGKGGNLELAKSCTYCPHRFKCWADANNGQGIRRFQYSNGVKELVQVLDTPRVEELPIVGGLISSTDGETQDESNSA